MPNLPIWAWGGILIVAAIIIWLLISSFTPTLEPVEPPIDI
jgi:hypothetical protein